MKGQIVMKKAKRPGQFPNGASASADWDFLRNCQVDVRKPESNAAQDIVIARCFFSGSDAKPYAQVKVAIQRIGSTAAHGKNFLQERFVKDKRKAQGNNRGKPEPPRPDAAGHSFEGPGNPIDEGSTQSKR